MQIGLLLPQGYFDEFDGWTPGAAWDRILGIARLGERLGFDSLWTGEHVLAKWDREGMIFDCVTIHTAVAAAVPRVDIGFGVINSTFRNPAMTAKMASTLDTISGGRLVLGLGCGFKPSEASAFGVAFPDMKERLAILGEHFEIISRMTRRDEPPFTFSGEHARVEDVLNNPRTGGGDHIRLAIGGHGPNVTFRLAARYCDEINIDLPPEDMAAARAVLADRCAEIGRIPRPCAWPPARTRHGPTRACARPVGSASCGPRTCPRSCPTTWTRSRHGPRSCAAGWSSTSTGSSAACPASSTRTRACTSSSTTCGRPASSCAPTTASA